MAEGTADLFPSPEPTIVPGRRFKARVEGVYVTPDGTESVPAEALTLFLSGIAGDRHHGFTRPSTSREPWYPRGTEVRHGRHLSVVSVEDLAEIARLMDVSEVRAEWIGTNVLVSGIPRLTFLPPGTRLIAEGGAAIVVEALNKPCRVAGRAIQGHVRDREGLEFLFPKVAGRLRGVVASAERAGVITPGASLDVHVPEHWIYAG